MTIIPCMLPWFMLYSSLIGSWIHNNMHHVNISSARVEHVYSSKLSCVQRLAADKAFASHH